MFKMFKLTSMVMLCIIVFTNICMHLFVFSNKIAIYLCAIERFDALFFELYIILDFLNCRNCVICKSCKSWCICTFL